MSKRPAASPRPLLAIGLFLTAAACEGTCFSPPPETLFSVDFVHPVDRQVLTFSDDADPNTAGFQYTVEVTGSDSDGREVTLDSASVETRLSTETAFAAGATAVLSGPTATFPGTTLRQGTNVLRVSVVEAGSGRQASRQINVDVQIGRPEVRTLVFQGDSNGDGILNQSEQATGDPVVAVTTAGLEDGQPVVIKDQATLTTVYGTGTASGGSATVALTGLMATATTEGSFDLVAEVTDRAGRTNKLSSPTPSEPLNTTAFRTLRIDRVAPELTVVAPTGPVVPIQLHMVDDADPAATGFQVRVTVRTSADVVTDGVTIVRTPSGQSTPLTPDPVRREATLDFTVPDLGPFDYTFDLRVEDPAKNTRSGQVRVQIGQGGTLGFFTGLQFSDNTLNAEPAGPFKFDVRRMVPFGPGHAIVAITNEGYWMASDTASLPTTHIMDQDLATPGAQVMIQGYIASGVSCAPKMLFAGVEKAADVALTSNTPTLVRLTATLDTDTAGPLQLAADCGGGRLFPAVGPMVTVDVDPPSAVTPTLTLLTAGSFSARRPGIDVTWPGSNDDGTANRGAPAGYVVKWSTDGAAPFRTLPTSQAGDYDVKSGIDSNADFFDTRVSAQVGSLFPDSMRSARITGLPSFGAFYVQVRAKDDVGNLGLLAPTACAAPGGGSITGTCVDHQLGVVTISNNALTEGNIGFVMAAGNVNGDAFDDLVFISNTRSSLPIPPVPQTDLQRPAWIAYGGSDMNAFAAVTPANQIPIPTSTLDPVTGFYDVTVANVGDRAGDAPTGDVILAAPNWGTRRGRYFIFFGRPGGASMDTANPVELRGLGSGSNLPVGSANDIGYARPIADFGRPGGGAPDGLAELAISADNENGGNGRVYLFYGRPHDTSGGAGSWEALRVTDADGIQFVPMSAADRVFTGEAGPLCTTCSPQTTQSFFGTRKGYVSLGDVTGDGIPDLGIPAARDFVNRMYLYSGAAVNAATGAIAAGGPEVIQRLQGSNPTIGSPTGTLRGLGSDGAGGLELLGGTGRDLALGYPRDNSVLLYPNGTASGYASAPFVIDGKITRFGNSVVPADVNGDGRVDLIVGSNAGVSLNDGFPGGGYVFYQSATAGAEFEPTRTGLQVSWLKKDRNETLPSDAMGIAVAAGDFNGDSRVDVVVSDHRMGAPTSTNQGKIFVRY